MNNVLYYGGALFKTVPEKRAAPAAYEGPLQYITGRETAKKQEAKMIQADATLTVRTNKTLKERVGKILNELGLNHSTAINMFYHQVLAKKGIPFDVKIPNKETEEALRNSRERKNLTTYKDSDELFEDLGI